MKKIAIVAGGDSSEWEVSLRSAEGLMSFIGEEYEKFLVVIVGKKWQVKISENEVFDIDKNDFSFVKNDVKVKFDFAYITIHGTPGENGILQGYFDLIGLPYSCCGVLTAALTFDKFVCKQFLRNFGVEIAESVLLRKNQNFSKEEILEKVGLPCFVKPNADGSSFGVTKVKTAEMLETAIAKAFAEGGDALVEAELRGTEITCGAYKTKSKSVVLPITEVVTDNEFFDYDAKYNGQVTEITPARLSAQMTKKVQDLTLSLYDVLGARGIIRIDYIISPDGKINLLEVNTTPGMTKTSFIPQQIRAAGLAMNEVMADIIENC